MKKRVLIVEDQFIEANNLQTLLEKAGYEVLQIAQSVNAALNIMTKQTPDLVLLDIFLKGTLTGIDLAEILREKNIAFVYLSANSNKSTLEAAKNTYPYGFLIKPFRERDVLVTLDIADYLHKHKIDTQATPKDGKRENISQLKRLIIGESQALITVLDQVSIAAPSEVSVLIQGESGTGKELISDAIHTLSARKDKPYVRVNCAALPSMLFESELFGHEKGAFTGAVERKIGKFEKAHNGTIFLDEIGEIPLDLQVKLLNVLQAREIERIGGGSVVKVNVRVIAATNRDLENEVALGRFRMDLFYRLNVFPINLPPLRDRKEDIPLLVEHFLQIFSKKLGKTVTNISKSAFKQLYDYDWPGNLRELENVIERNVLLCQGETITDLQLAKTSRISGLAESPKAYSNDREYLAEVLKSCGGRIAGKGGAADILGINVTTLHARLKKLGITKSKIFKV